MADRRLHDVARAQVLADRARLRRRLDDHERGARLDLLRLLGRFARSLGLGIERGLLLRPPCDFALLGLAPCRSAFASASCGLGAFAARPSASRFAAWPSRSRLGAAFARPSPWPSRAAFDACLRCSAQPSPLAASGLSRPCLRACGRFLSSLLTASSLERALDRGSARKTCTHRETGDAHERIDVDRGAPRDRIADAHLPRDRIERGAGSRGEPASAASSASRRVSTSAAPAASRRSQPRLPGHAATSAALTRDRARAVDSEPDSHIRLDDDDRIRERRDQRIALRRTCPRRGCDPVGQQADERAAARDDLLRTAAHAARDTRRRRRCRARPSSCRRRRARRDGPHHRCRARRPRRRGPRAPPGAWRARGRAPSRSRGRAGADDRDRRRLALSAAPHVHADCCQPSASRRRGNPRPGCRWANDGGHKGECN